MNLLQETIGTLENNGKTFDDINWIGSMEYGFIELEDFKQLADYDYNSGYGSPHVATDLVIVGSNWWLERHEYDGSEWWEFKELLRKPQLRIIPKAIVGNRYMWKTIKEMDLGDKVGRILGERTGGGR